MIRSGPSKKGYSTSSASDTVSMTLALPDGVYVMLNVGFSLMLNVVFLFVHSSFCSGTGNYINRLIHRNEKKLYLLTERLNWKQVAYKVHSTVSKSAVNLSFTSHN